MGSRFKEDERHERIIRSLLKRDENKKCMNCGSLGPQYVCTNFATFICMTCSGIHREFTHRVKSISMAKFTPEEVAALQSGGNQRAFETFFRSWDPQRHPLPDSRHPEKLRDFIKAVYVDRLFTGDKLPNDVKRPSMLRSSLSFEDRQLHGGNSSSRTNLPHQRTRSEDRPSSIRDYEPPVLSMRDILGDDLPPLRIEATTQARNVPSVDAQRSGSQISRFGSFVGTTSSSPHPAVYKRASSESHIEFVPGPTRFVEQQPDNPTRAAGFITDDPTPVAGVPTPADFLAQQPYVKADTTGWATFDTAPSSTNTETSVQAQAFVQPVQQHQLNTMETFAQNFPQPVQHNPWNFPYPRPQFMPNFYVQPFPYATPFPNQPYIPEAYIPQPIPRNPRTTNPFDLPDDLPLEVMSPGGSFTFQQQQGIATSTTYPEGEANSGFATTSSPGKNPFC